MSKYKRDQIPMRLIAGAAATGLGLISYGLYKAGVNSEFLTTVAISKNPFIVIPPAAAGLLTAGAAGVALAPWADNNVEAPVPEQS